MWANKKLSFTGSKPLISCCQDLRTCRGPKPQQGAITEPAFFAYAYTLHGDHIISGEAKRGNLNNRFPTHLQNNSEYLNPHCTREDMWRMLSLVRLPTTHELHIAPHTFKSLPPAQLLWLLLNVYQHKNSIYRYTYTKKCDEGTDGSEK